jgi:hypothetical protein|tara:strand:- start:447 stop:1031 length:585 start_codon:yes stop_codon:yes gene_type:complete
MASLYQKSVKKFPGISAIPENQMSVYNNPSKRGFVEFFPWHENRNPDIPYRKYRPLEEPMKNVVEFRREGMKLPPKQKVNVFGGESLHAMEEYSPEWDKLKKTLIQTYPMREQEGIQNWIRQQQIKRKSPYVENRPVQDWFNRSFVDAIIRGNLIPDLPRPKGVPSGDNEWRQFIRTPEQKLAIKELEKILMGK